MENDAREQEQENALLDLDGMTVLLDPHPEDPFQDVGERGESTGREEELPPVGPEEWLED